MIRRVLRSFRSRLVNSLREFIRRVFDADVHPPLDVQDEYNYTVLEYMPSLSENEKIPLVILAEVPMVGEEGVLYVGLGRSLTEEELESASELGKHVLRQMGSWLESEVTEAVESGNDPLNHLSESCKWNLNFRKPEKRESERVFQDVLLLFRKEVLEKAPEEVRQKVKRDLKSMSDEDGDVGYPRQSDLETAGSDISLFQPAIPASA